MLTLRTMALNIGDSLFPSQFKYSNTAVVINSYHGTKQEVAGLPGNTSVTITVLPAALAPRP